MRQYLYNGIVCFLLMWKMGRSMSTYFPDKKWKKYHMIENEFLRKICIRNEAFNLRDKNKLRQPAFIIYTILIPTFLVFYTIGFVVQFNIGVDAKIRAYIFSIAIIISIAAFFLAAIITIIDVILTEK